MVALWKATIGFVEEYVGLNLKMYPVLVHDSSYTGQKKSYLYTFTEKKNKQRNRKKRNELKNKNQRKIL